MRRDANSVVQTAYLQPAANLDRLEYLLVILDYEGGLPPLEQQPIDCTPTDGGPDASGDPGTLPEGEQPCLTATPTPTAGPSSSGTPLASPSASSAP